MQTLLAPDLVELPNDIHVRCGCHIINIAVKKFLAVINNDIVVARKLVNSICASLAGWKIFYMLASQQTILNQQQYHDQIQTVSNPAVVKSPAIVRMPTPACVTRWNSMYSMLDSLLNARAVIDQMCNRHDRSPWEQHKISPEKWSLFERYRDFLQEAYHCTAVVGGEAYVTISLQPKIMTALLNQCSRTLSDNSEPAWVTDNIRNAIKAMEDSLKKYQPYMQGLLPKLALFLDPRELRTSPMVIEMKEHVKELIWRYYTIEPSNQVCFFLFSFFLF